MKKIRKNLSAMDRLICTAAKEIKDALVLGGVGLAIDAYVGTNCRTDYTAFGEAIRAELENQKLPMHILDRIFYLGAGERENARTVYRAFGGI